MKKIFLSLVALFLILVTVHMLMPTYGGLLGVGYRAQGRIVSYYATVIHDPGVCALIRGYWGRSIREKLRDRCVSRYILEVVQEKSDCGIESLPSDFSDLSNFWLRDEYRYTCLMRHYKAMLGNSLTQEWLPKECLKARDNLVIMEHYLQYIRLSRVTKENPTDISSPLSKKDITLIEQCEGFLDTPQIYTFLRDDAHTVAETQYITAQQKRIFQFR